MRVERDWTLENLAVRAGLSRSHLSLIERGLRSPSLTTLHKLAASLEISIAELVSPLGE